MSASYGEMKAILKIDSIITLIRNMGEKHSENPARDLDEYIIRELEETKRLLELG